MLLTSSGFGYKSSFTRLVTAVCYHPDYSDRAIVFNLNQDPEILLELDIDELKKLTFTRKSDLPKGLEKLELNELVFNKSPMFVCSPNEDSFKLSPNSDRESLRSTWKIVLKIYHLSIKIDQKLKRKCNQFINNHRKDSKASDVDQSLYDGFISKHDRTFVMRFKIFHPKILIIIIPHLKIRNLISCF